jgi:hypothetical protein
LFQTANKEKKSRIFQKRGRIARYQLNEGKESIICLGKKHNIKRGKPGENRLKTWKKELKKFKNRGGMPKKKLEKS